MILHLVVRGPICMLILHQADEQQTAQDMVRRYDLAVQRPGADRLVHRVSHYLLGTRPGQLGLDFRRWAVDGHMSARLRTELTAYQLCVLDDSFVESPHAHVSRAARPTSRPSPSWWSASIRLEQNLRDYDRSVRDAPGRFDQLFSQWKLLGQFRQAAYLAGQPLRIRTAPFLRSVYRTGAEHTQRDWTVLRPLADADHSPDIKPSDMAALMKEYLVAVFAPASVIEVRDTRGVSVGELLSGKGQQSDESALVPVRDLYQVVSHSLVSKRFVSTENLARIRAMRVPVVLQRLTIHDQVGQDPSTIVAVPEGFPEVRCVRDLGSWNDLRYGSQSWSVQKVEENGSLVLADQRPLGQLAWTPY